MKFEIEFLNENSTALIFDLNNDSNQLVDKIKINLFENIFIT